MMRLSRLFVAQALAADTVVTLREAAAHYVRDVLRLEQGAALRVFDGSGAEFRATLDEVQRHAVCLTVGDPLSCVTESPLAIHLGIGLARGERMDWVVQKCTELGVATITPLLLARCNAKFDGTRADSRLRHWLQVAIAACEQSGRTRVPAIGQPVVLQHWLATYSELPGLVLHTSDSGTLPGHPAPTALRVLVGPEGGLDASEFALAHEAGLMPWSLGPRILRTETAPVAALAILQHRWGDLGP